MHLPHSRNLELSLIASLMAMGDEDMFKYMASIDDDIFFHPDVKKIWETIDDTGTVNSAVLIDRAGPECWGLITDCVEMMSTTTSVRPIIEELTQYAVRRKAIVKLKETADSLSDVNVKLSECAEGIVDVNRMVEASIRCGNDHGLQSLEELLPSMISELQSWYSPNTNTISFGHKTVDYMLGKVISTDLILLGARPSIGKSSLALQVGLHNARNGIGVAYFTMEMSKTMSLARAICAELPFSYHDIRSGIVPMSKLSESDFVNKIREIRKDPLYFCDIARITPSQLLDQIDLVSQKMKPGLIILDHLHLAGADGKHENETGRLGSISSDLKSIAQTRNVPVLALSQLNRGNEKDNRAPVLSDLRSSGSLEQDADNVIFLHRPNMKAHCATGNEPAEIIIAKQRNGPIGTAASVFYRSGMKWFDAEEREPDEVIKESKSSSSDW